MGQGQHQGQVSSAGGCGEHLFCWRQLGAAFELHVAQRSAQIQRAIHASIVHEATSLHVVVPRAGFDQR